MAINRYGVSFNGRRIVHPGAYDATNTSGTTVVTQGSLNTPIMIGTANAGESGKVLWFTDATELRNTLRGGDLVHAAELMFSPIPEGGGGASIVGVIVANQNTQATLTAGGFTFKAREFGDGGNRVKVAIADGTITGSKKVTVSRWDTEEMEIFDNLGALLAIEYTGSETTATVEVVAATGTATKLTTKLGSQTDLDLDLTLEQFGTIERIASHINSIEGYTATFVDYGANATLPSSALEAVTSTSIKSTPVYLKSVKADVVQQLNSYSRLVSAEAQSAAVSNVAGSNLTGGSVGTAPASWTSLLNLVKGQYSDVLVLLTDSEAIHAEGLAHIQQMELRNQKQMLFVGGGAGETVEQAKQRASVLNSSRAVLAYPGIYHSAIGNGRQLLPSYFTAALIAGRVCGVDASEPVTFEYFNLIGLEFDNLVGDPSIDSLIAGGVATLEKVQNGTIRLAQGVTTYLGSVSSVFREISSRRAADKVSSNMRIAMEDAFIGQKGLQVTASAIHTKAIDILEEAIVAGDITAYRNIVVRFQNNIVYVDYEVAIVEPINFVLITSHFFTDNSITVAGEELNQ